MVKIGIIREEKQPRDTRTPLIPLDCKKIEEKFKNVKFIVQPSTDRCFKDDEYKKEGIMVDEDMSKCDILMGVKEVPVQNLIPNKKYLFFSHTIKKQAYNLKLIQALLVNKIEMIDYETLVDTSGKRIVAFGYWAGIVGAYNTLWMIGQKNQNFNLPRLNKLKDYEEALTHIQNLPLDGSKIVLTGTGRVATGAQKVLDDAGIKRLSPKDFLKYKGASAVYTQLTSADLYTPKDKKSEYDRAQFHEKPYLYVSAFEPYSKVADVLINGMFWDIRAPKLFKIFDMHKGSFNIKIIGDITCDIAPESSVPCTFKATSIENPVFGYLPVREKVTEPFIKKGIDIMAIPNLPNELPRDASVDFSHNLTEKIIPLLFEDRDDIIKGATICKKGKLTDDYMYLESFVFDDNFRLTI